MKLEIGKSYRNENGTVETVAGLTKHYPEWVWTIQGNWYRQSDGAYIGMTRKIIDGKETYERIPTPGRGDLKYEVEELFEFEGSPFFPKANK